MRKSLSYFLVIAVAVIVSAVSCDRDETVVIPRGKLAQIYAEILVTDQWIMGKPGVRRMADTTLVYEPIFEAYGYTTDDYLKSVDVYMDDPERFSKILRETVVILDKRIESLKKLQEELQKIEDRKRFKVTLTLKDYFPYTGEEPESHYFDSLAVDVDTVTGIYRMTRHEKVRPADTLMIVDSVLQTDTIAVENIKE